MGLPTTPVTLAPDQIADLNRRLSMMRHNINNQLALIVAASELIRRKPEMLPRLIENILQQPDRVTQEMRDFSEEFEAALGIVRESTTVITRAPAP
jgi:hypothetical protein